MNSELSTVDREMYLKQLVDKYYMQLCVVSVQYTDSLDVSEDIVQDVFLHLWEDKRIFSVDKNQKAYLFQSVRNASIDYVRKNKKFCFEELEEASYVTEEHISEEELKTQYKKLHDVLSLLPPQEYQVLMAIVVDNKKYKEVAEEMDISVNTVKTHFSRALKFLRNQLPLSILLILLSPN